MNQIRAIAFDCDGVMFDTTRANQAYYNTLLRKFGRPDLTPEQFVYIHAHSVHDSIAFLFDGEATREAVHAFRESMNYMPFVSIMEIDPQLKPLIRRLRPAFKTAVATNRTDTMDRVIVEHGLEGLFDLVVCAKDVARPKPHPDLLFKVLEHFHLTPNQMAYVGDSQLDEQAARAAHVPFLAFRNPGLHADVHIDSLIEIESLLPGTYS